MNRPNILVIHSDQHRFDCLGVNGHPQLKTPNLDRIAAEGINFTDAHCPNPLCCPARASFLTGQWTSEHLQIANTDTEAPRGFRLELETWPRLLRDAGYWLGYIGKWHAHPEKGPEYFGFNEFTGWGYKQWREEQGVPPVPCDKAWFGQIDPHIKPEESALAYCAGLAIDMMERCVADEQPFVVRWDPPQPHLPNRVPEPYASMYPPESIEPWSGWGDSFEGKPWVQQQQLRTWGLEDWTWSDWQPVVSRYLGEISLLDAQVGRLLDTLDRLGVADNTLVVYTADHGDMCGSHGMIDKHFILYDDVVRVPLLMRFPGRIEPGQTCNDYVCNAIDLAATFCDVGDVPTPETFRGTSLAPLFDGSGSTGRDDIYCAYHGNQFGLYSQRMVRDRRYKYIWNATAEDEFYDLERDPGELHNAANDPQYSAEITHLKERLIDWMETTNDRLINGWTRAHITGEGLAKRIMP